MSRTSPLLSRLGSWVGSVALTLVALLLCAAVGELGLRLTSATRPAGHRQRLNVYRASATLNHELRPDWQVQFTYRDFDVLVKTNALGFRGPEVPLARTPGRVRILVVGDSFPFGWGVENDEMFGSVLERRLRAEGVPAEVISAGVPGYSTDQNLIFLRERGFDLAPHLVVLAICGNDTDELAWKDMTLDAQRLPTATVSRRRFINRRGEMQFLNASLLALPEAPLPEALRAWLLEHSWAYGWLRIRLARSYASWMDGRIAAADQIEDAAVSTEPIATLSAEEIARSLRGNAGFRLRYHRYLVDAMEGEATARGIPLRTLLIAGAEAGLREDCARTRCLAQSDSFTRESDPATHLPVDGHWSALGHEKVGEALAAWLLADPDLELSAL